MLNKNFQGWLNENNKKDLIDNFIKSLDDLLLDDIKSPQGLVFDVILHPNTLIEPKIDSGNPLHKQSPYLEIEHESLELNYLNKKT